MNIRPKIPIYLGGSTLDLDKWILENLKYYDWYSKLYPNAQVLLGSPLKQRNDNWDKNKLSSSHYTTDDLRRSAYNNYLYTQDYDARLRDLIYWSEQLKGLDKLTDLQLVDLYNKLAQTIRDAREVPQTYNTTGYSGTNQTFRNMFYNRSKLGTNAPAYNIGYLENLDNIEGTSTWQRRMDRYENPFEKDTQEGQQNRTFYINIPGTDRLVKVYKKENGDLGLFPNSPNTPPSLTPQKQTGTSFNSTEKLDPKNDFWQKLSAGFNKIAPDLLAAVRYAGNMHNNERVYNEMKQAIIPNLLGTYTTHRQIVGDEATKLAYYRRAAQGESKAAKAFTSDADRQMAYMMEAKRVGDELRALGDLADNLEIRRTSDESNQHQWANALRANEVANANITELNKAKAAKHQLAAQKYTADWTNTDLYLMGWESKFKLKLAEEKALNRQLALLDVQGELLLNDTLSDLRARREKAYLDYIDNKDKTKTELLKKIFDDINKQYLLADILAKKEMYRKYLGIYSAKSGTKITKKDNSDKFLYKTSRDIVEHFRRMSKMTDDSRIRTMPKPVKLSSHPRKMLMGGVAPFTIYRPLGAGMETTALTSTSTDSKSLKDTAVKDKLDMIKELFKQVQGLPVDVSLVYLRMVGVFNKARAFGEEMSSDDIAAMYLSSMNEIAKLKYSLKAYEDARNVAVANDAMNEIAVGANGEIALYDSENLQVKRGSLKQLLDSDGKLMALTNGQLLTMRAHSPNLAFDDQVFDIVNNGIGMSKIATHIKSIAGTIGSMETKIEGITKVESDKIKSGLRELAEAPEGYYKITLDKKDSSANINVALNYIYNILPKNYRTILELNSNGNGLKLIYSMLASQVNDYNKMDIDPLTGKAAKDANGNSKEGSEGLKLDAATALITGKGYKSEIELNPGSNYAVKALGRFSEFQKKSGENMGAGTTMLEATESTIKGNLDWNKATIGGSRIIPTAYNQIILNNGEVAGIDLPVDPSNPDAPNFEMLKQLENLDKLLKLNNIEDSELNWKKVNEICDKIGIPHKYDSDGKLNLTLWKRFAAFLVTTPDTALVNKNVILDMVGIASKEERDLYNSFILNKTNNKKFELSDTFLGLGHRDELYKGTIFVPIKESIVASAISGGLNIYMNQATDLELREQGYDSSKVKSYKKSEYSL